MATNYAYYYAQLDLETGMCVGVSDTSNYILAPGYVPIETYTLNYFMKYYYPIPETVESFDDFQGQWYSDAAHTIPWNP
jgi:hypothetical protein